MPRIKPRARKITTTGTPDNPKGFNAAVLVAIDFLGGDRRTGMCKCPCHDDGRNPSLQISNGDKHPIVLHCFGIGTKEHDLEVIRHLQANGAWPTSDKLTGINATPAAEAKRSPDQRRRYARWIWNGLLHNGGAELNHLLREYVCGKRCLAQLPYQARVALPLITTPHPKAVAADDYPAMVLPIRNKRGEFFGVYVAWLNNNLSDKCPGEMPYQTYGMLQGNFIPLVKIEWDRRLPKLLIAEGWATAAAAAQVTGLPAIASGGKGFFKHIDPPDADEYLICVDADDDGGSRKDAGLLAQMARWFASPCRRSRRAARTAMTGTMR
jgi:hypothetical protein